MVESIQPQIIRREIRKIPRPTLPHIEEQIAALESHIQRSEFEEDMWGQTLTASDLKGGAITTRNAQLILLRSIFGVHKTVQIFDKSKKLQNNYR